MFGKYYIEYVLCITIWLLVRTFQTLFHYDSCQPLLASSLSCHCCDTAHCCVMPELELCHTHCLTGLLKPRRLLLSTALLALPGLVCSGGWGGGCHCMVVTSSPTTDCNIAIYYKIAKLKNPSQPRH